MGKKNLELTKVGLYIRMFQDSMRSLECEKIKLDEDYQIARNLACSEYGLSQSDDVLMPMKICHKEMDRLRQNSALHVEMISIRRYMTMKAFLPLLPPDYFKEWLPEEHKRCYEYWDDKIGSLKPDAKFELKNRFA